MNRCVRLFASLLAGLGVLGTLACGNLKAGAAGAANPAAPGSFFIHDGDRVVLLGDSITAQKLHTTYIEAYALTRFPKCKLTFRNAGWGGDTAWLRQRHATDENALFAAAADAQQKMVEASVGAGLSRDVLPLKPTLVTINFGMNDHSYQAFRPDIFRAYVRSQTQLVKVLKNSGARVALLTPQPIEERRADPDKDVRNESLRKFGDGLKDVAAKEGALYVDQFDPYMAVMMRARSTDPNATIGGGDAVHPGPAGQTIMAWAILKGLGATGDVSSADLRVNGFLGRKSARTKNCSVANVKFDGGVLSFDRTDGALPMPIDARAEAALKLVDIQNDLNRYELKVAGLKAALYEVKIDGAPVGKVARANLATGWNMATVTTPMSRQALQVLDMVFKKNEMPSMGNQIVEMEAQIDSARQPKCHHFELTPAEK